MFIFWIISIVATIFVAQDKKQSILLWFLLSLFLGPIALIIVLLLPKAKPFHIGTDQYNYSYLNSIKAELENIRGKFVELSNKLDVLETRINEWEIKIGEKIPQDYSKDNDEFIEPLTSEFKDIGSVEKEDEKTVGHK
ncbi:MAG: hypothetical protein NC822_02530 [Candidatus Omnitrophica bacterium]|nr:hypothetical protein [Candidatus Omnitrophota bacterium]